MMRFRFDDATWDSVIESIAVFLTSAQRGAKVPELAAHVLNGTGPQTLCQRLDALRNRLLQASFIHAVLHEARVAHHEPKRVS